MATDPLVEQLTSLPTCEEQRAFIGRHASRLDAALGDEAAAALKAQADRFLRSDVRRCLETADLLRGLAEVTGNPCHGALGLLAQANALSIGGLGEYQRAVELYDRAAAIFASCAQPAEQARSQVGKVWSLACLGRYAEAFATGEWACRVLEQHAQWRPLATLVMNLGAIHDRLGDDAASLRMLDRAHEIYLRLGPEGEPFLARVEHNRALLLRQMGRFDEAIAAARRSHDTLHRLGDRIEAARAKQNLAIIYYVMGRYNESLRLLDEVRGFLAADGRRRDVLLLDLFTSDCLLQLRRFADVLEKCRAARALFHETGVQFEAAQAVLNEAAAYAGLGQDREAMASLDEARRMFACEPNPVWTAHADLRRAAILLRQGRPEESLAAAQSASGLLQDHDLPVARAQADLAAAAAQAALGDRAAAAARINRVLAVAESCDLPALSYPAHHLLSAMAAAGDSLHEAQEHCARAIAEMERLRSQLMVEFRSGFVEDKAVLYEDMVGLCLDLGQPERGLEYAERAKSRALVDLLADQLQLDVQPRDDADRPLTERLARLRAERNRLQRRRLVEVRLERRGAAEVDDGPAILDLEREITGLWHQLLVRHADYARDAALHQVLAEPVQPYLAADVLLLEWFVARGRPVLFLVTRDQIRGLHLSVDMAEVQRLLALLRLNLDGVRSTGGAQAQGLVANARRLLGRLHDALLAPAGEIIGSHRRLIVVPHGPLHYLPFHALHDGASYLIERHELSYLPGSSVLRFCCEPRPAAQGLTAFGHSCEGRLPHAVEEARAVAGVMGGELALEGDATLARLNQAAARCRVLHVATHGDFRADNPLFSGLALADGWLTTLDCFSLPLQASLITLSGCHTGRSVVGGGDELLGLTRALLAAGAASLVLSLWAVEDATTAALMAAFYGHLAAGCAKGEALRRAQVAFIRGEGPGDPALAAHPYYWAPFALVGDAGPL